LSDDGPDFELPTNQGTIFRLRSVRGLEAVALLFLQRCDRDLSAYASVGDSLRQRGVRVIFLCAERDTRSPRAWNNFWVLYDRRGEVARRYGALDVITGNTVPAVFVLDRRGRVRYLAAGSLPSESDLTELVLDVLHLSEDGS
jgi:alkyl hydroperoxide reductase subunit AhpC